MRRFWVGLALLGVMAGGCGSTRPSAGPLITDFQRVERDLQAFAPSSPAAGMLRSGQAKRDNAAALTSHGDQEKAYPLMESALSDARAALASAQEDDASRQGDECLQSVNHARGLWEEALRQLVETEQVAKRTSDQAKHDVAGLQELLVPQLPPTTISAITPPQGSTNDLLNAEKTWLEVAESHKISAADLETRFDDELAQAKEGANDKESQMRHLYILGRTLQELEARVRRQISQDLCFRATAVLTNLADARASALRGVLELERGMKDDLRRELERTRVEAADQESRLSEALQQLAGASLKVARDSRGIVVTLLTDDFFELGKDSLISGNDLILVRLATVLNQYPEMKIAIEGHTDNVGEPDYNFDLSRRRAQTTSNYLTAQGVAASRITAAGFGQNRPATNNTTEDERRQNRRVELVIHKQP